MLRAVVVRDLRQDADRRTSATQAAAVLEAADVSALLLDDEGRVAAVTKGALQRWPLDSARLIGTLGAAIGLEAGAQTQVTLPGTGRRIVLLANCRPLPDGGSIAFLEEVAIGPLSDSLAALAECLRPVFFAVDRQGRITVWGSGAGHLLGHSPRDAIGTNIRDMAEDAGIELKEGLEDMPLRLRHADGRVVALQVSTVLVGRDARQTILVVCSDVQDIQDAQDMQYMREREELHQLMRSLEQENEAMARANRMKTNFLANMSHELRTPLNAILGFAKLLKGQRAGPLNARQDHYVARVVEGGEHLLSLINELLDLARIEGGEMDLHLEPVDLVRLGRETLDAVRPLAAPKELELVFESPEDALQADSDRVRFKQILFNLLNNAVKFTPEGGTIVLRILAATPGSVRLEVEDTGIGIPQERLAEVFDDFMQVQSPMSKGNPGVGLGLAITKRIVEAMGGEVGVVSTVGEGSTFFVVLPRSPEVAAAPDRKGSEEGPHRRAGKGA